MDQQEYQGMMEVISSVLGPFCGKIVQGKIVIDIPPPLRPAGPLVGFGDDVEIGNWVRVASRPIDDTMPLQVVHYDLRPGHESISLLNRVYNVQFNYQVAGGHLFTVVPLDDVPLYLQEAYPRNQTELDTWKMLTKAQILEKYAGVQEALCYVVLFSIPYKRPDPVRPNYVHRDFIPMRFTWEQGMKRPKLAKVAEIWPCNGNPYGNVGEKKIQENGYIVSQRCFGYALFDPEGDGYTLKRFMRHLVKQKWQLEHIANGE